MGAVAVGKAVIDVGRSESGIPVFAVGVPEMGAADGVARSEVAKRVDDDPGLLEPIGSVELAERVKLENVVDVLELKRWVKEVDPAELDEVNHEPKSKLVVSAVPVVAVLLRVLELPGEAKPPAVLVGRLVGVAATLLFATDESTLFVKLLVDEEVAELKVLDTEVVPAALVPEEGRLMPWRDELGGVGVVFEATLDVDGESTVEVPKTEVVADVLRPLASEDTVIASDGTKTRTVVLSAEDCWVSGGGVVEVIELRLGEDIELEIAVRPVPSANCEEVTERELAVAS